jgi:serine/threonine protein kinase
MTLTAGSRLGPYEIVAPLGAGGMGEVYRAKDPRLGRDVAIKVLPASVSQDHDRLRRFEQEARAAGLLNHPNITAVYDIGSADGAPYVVTELLEGETLRSRLAVGPVPVRKALDYAIQIARGLAAAHEKGIVHRDLKPENLFLTKDGRVKILDFGLAKLKPSESEEREQTNLPTGSVGTEPGVVLGTMGYMSPEQVRG